ncbi:uncharacterized protein EI90DRAFT_3029866 [Cantharellus anzutake]|uniref:uncharacterized protein n=1 Tax=Cantharellus anzutake TaxID=1750568 RepID=UPI0019079436|nr:uncharacterized protein EI90DRAFT_3029866 [Cantharellus anzutake]KAF8342684.1 hypothetical protein EI90DRAFT_3029866 [Cantharellus anzutake]
MVASFHLVATLLALAAAFLSVSAQTIPACSQACAVNATRSAGCGGFTNLGVRQHSLPYH